MLTRFFRWVLRRLFARLCEAAGARTADTRREVAAELLVELGAYLEDRCENAGGK